MSKALKIILGVTGSIAAYKAAEIIRSFQKEDVHVVVVMTASSERFITPLTLGALSGQYVYTDRDEAQTPVGVMPHIKLAAQADAMVIAPATAHTIAKLATGLCDDLLSCLALMVSAPMFLAPAMNTTMYQHPLVQENCQKLRQHGVHIVEPIDGELACGMVGQGHIAQPQDIVSVVIKHLKSI